MIGGKETNESKRKVRTDRYMLQIDVHKRFCTLKERIWLNTLCEKNEKARDLAGAMLCPDIIESD